MNRKIEKAKKKLQKISKKIWRNRRFRRALLASGLVVVSLAALFFVFNLIYQDKIFPHTYIGGQNFGGETPSRAKEHLEEMITQSQNGQFAYTWEQKTYSTDIQNLEVNYSDALDQTMNRLMSVGRTGSLTQVLAATARAVFGKNVVYANFYYNEGKLNDYLMSMAKDINQAEKDATIEIKNSEPTVVLEATGRKFEVVQNRQIILDCLGSFNFTLNLPLKISTISPKITSAIAQAAIPETMALMKRQLTLKAENKTFMLYPQDIVGLIEFVARPAKNNILTTPQETMTAWILSPEISADKLQPLIEKIAGDVYQEAKDPKFEVKSGRVVAFQIAQTGYELDKTEATSQIVEAIKNDKGTLDLPVKVTEPAISSDNPEEMGIKELIGEGSTSWRGSPSNRIHNLTLGASKISGTIIKPGEEFSTVKAISPINAAAGFLPELVIKNSTQVTPEIGGGLCQVSTTLFRAVLNSGLKITARTPHSFRVSYYEPPVGMDATIYDPAPDFKFINNMATPIFIWAASSNTGLDFQIYGTKDGRKIEISDPVVFDYTSPPAPVYTLSESMEPGEIRQVERATSGATASFTYKVTSASGEVLQNETFTSKYVALPDSFLYGPGTEGIPAPPPEEQPAP